MIIKSNTAGDKLRIVVAKTIASSTSLDIAPSDESESSSDYGDTSGFGMSSDSLRALRRSLGVVGFTWNGSQRGGMMRTHA